MFKLVTCFAIVSVVLGDFQERHVPALDGRIVGGSDTTIQEHPHQISLQYFSRHICGGSIISPIWVITAAHCVDGAILPSFLTVRLGTTYVGNGGQVITVLTTIVHSFFNGVTYDYDIALLKLSSSTTSNPIAKTIGLPSDESGPRTGETATITGWGTLTEGGSTPSVLQEVQVPIVSQADCQTAYNRSTITPRMFCAGYLGVGGKDACQGDSGGPVIVNGILYGLVSWGQGCARPEYPGVYTSVANLRQWISDNTGI